MPIAERVAWYRADEPVSFARLASRAAELSSASGRPGEQSGPTDQESFAQAAVHLLGQAFAAGFRDVSRLRTEKDFNSLRKRSDFAALLARVEKGDFTPSKPSVGAGAEPTPLPPVGPSGIAAPSPTNFELDIRARGDRAAGRYALGEVRLLFGQYARAERTLGEARDLFAALVRDDPKNPRHKN